MDTDKPNGEQPNNENVSTNPEVKKGKPVLPENATIEQKAEFYENEFNYWKSQARTKEDLVKELAPLADNWRDYEKSQKPKEQQLQEELDALKAEITQKNRQELVTRLVTENGLPAAAVANVSGNTEEEIKNSINGILTWFTKPEDPAKKPVAPNPLQGFPSQPAAKEETALEKAFRQAMQK